MSFDTLGLSPALLRALSEQGYTVPTPIQCAAIPVALAGRDLLASAQTGTGKTAAFALPLLERLFTAPRLHGASRKPRALILTPTRELAAQVHESVRDYAKHLRVSTTAIFGGVGMGPQMQALRRGVDVLVATPGRLIDHMERRIADLSGVEILVLDEGDRMLDMGFLPAIKRILGSLPDGVDQMAAADGRDKTVEASRARLARIVGRDADDAPAAAWTALARWFAEAQVRAMTDGAVLVLSGTPLAIDAPVVSAGIGGLVVAEVARRLRRDVIAFDSLLDVLPRARDAASHCAPAAALALLGAATIGRLEQLAPIK